jgi:hypothetical protein
MTINHLVRQVFTAEDLLMMLDDGFRYELIRGELIKRRRREANTEALP